MPFRFRVRKWRRSAGSRPRASRFRVAWAPFATAYTLIVVADYWALAKTVPSAQAFSIVAWVSTDVENLVRRPLLSLIGSALVPAPPLSSMAGFLTVGIGLGCCLRLIEVRHGSRVAAAVFASGHIGATLLTAPVIILAVAGGFYPEAVYHSLDFGISYGAVCTIGAVVASSLPRWLCVPVVVLGVAYILSLATWYGVIPDFTTVGHLWSVVIGLSAGFYLQARHPGSSTSDTGPGRNRYAAPTPQTIEDHDYAPCP